VAQTLLLVGYNNPRKKLDLPFRHLLKSYCGVDPPPQPQLVLPVATVEQSGAYHQAPNSARTRATADLIIMAFFFLLQISKYAMLKANTHTCTAQFRVQDVTFCQDNLVLPNTVPLTQLLLANSVVLYMDNHEVPPFTTPHAPPGFAQYVPWPSKSQAAL
jgi:hypothetical protein